ncbi:hypothetical protein AB0H77_40645 [Streptomyces sp. NPDC050844]|uniref:hypothetical protein n=1 Tax=Streptomyces sp. NPDC050844 TaxID=3155790 RepID=UPI0033C819E8
MRIGHVECVACSVGPASSPCRGLVGQAAAKAETEALVTAADKLVAELQDQMKKEIREASKPMSDDELRAAVEKRFSQYRRGLFGSGDIKDLKPGEIIAAYIGLDEIEACARTKSVKCLKGLALNALKVKWLKRAKPCKRNSFVQPKATVSGPTPQRSVPVCDCAVATEPHRGSPRPRRGPRPVSAFTT